MAYGCGGSSPPFRTIYKGSNEAKLLFTLSFFFYLKILEPRSRYIFGVNPSVLVFWKRILLVPCLKSVHTPSAIGCIAMYTALKPGIT